MDIAAPCAETLVFDVETQRLSDEVGGWNNIRKMGLAAAVVYSMELDSFSAYLEADAAALVERLASARLVVGFNVLRFDYEVLLAYTTHPLRSLPTLDIMVELQRPLGFRPRLADVAAGTLGTGKSADGVQSVQWFREGLIDKVVAYCTEDVRLTAELYRYGRANGHVLLRDRYRGTVRVPVHW